MLELFIYPFMVRAIIAGGLLAAFLAILSPFVYLRKMSFFADGIAHASLAGVAIGLLTSSSPFLVAVISGIVFALIIYFIEKKYNFSSDALIGLIFTSGMSLGVLLMSFKSGYQPELVSFLFGNILAVKASEIWIMLAIFIIFLVFVYFNFKNLVIFSLDKDLAYTDGIKINFLHPCLYVITALAVVLGLKILGIVLVSALLIIPVSVAKLFSRSFKSLVLISLIFSLAVVFIGIIISYIFDLPTGPTIVLLGTVLFIFSSLLKHKNFG